jgi:hypothetical protein
MKNIHILPTDKPSRLYFDVVVKELLLQNRVNVNPTSFPIEKRHIYITNNEEIKEGDWFLNDMNILFKADKNYIENPAKEVYIGHKKIIITTDLDLINDGVQSIPDEFLEWFVKNPSCEELKIGKEEDLMMEVPMAQYPKDETKKLFTDYPITELGDEEFKEAPIRECELLFYDDNKYCYVKVEGVEKEIKRGYIYTKPGRCGEVDCISIDEINKLIEVNKQKQHLIDIMESDEELGLYEQIDQNNPVTKGSTALVKKIKFEDVFNDEKREKVKRVIHQHKVLKSLSLVNPAHLQMTSNGHGEFPDGYKLTEKGIQYIIEQLNKE